MTIRRRPHRSNTLTFNDRAAAIVRSTKPPKSKRIYWTEAKLRQLMRGLIKPDREQWFAARLKALRSWPHRTSEEIMEAASRIQPGRLMHGRWAWPKRELEIQRDLQLSAPSTALIWSSFVGR